MKVLHESHMKVLNEYMLKEYEEEIIFEGVRFHVDFTGLSVPEFAEKLLLIINWKSNHSEYRITNVKTFYGTDIIEVETYNEESTMHFLKQLVNEYSQITINEKITVIDLKDMDVGAQLEALGVIEEFGEFVLKA